MKSKNKPEIYKHLHIARSLWQILKTEIQSSVHLPLPAALWGWQHGFTRSSLVAYGLNESNVKNFLTDFELFKTIRVLNSDFSSILNNKIIFERFFYNYKHFIQKNYFFLQEGEINSLSTDVSINTWQDVLELIYRLSGIVFKPIVGNSGKNVCVIKAKDGHLMWNNKVETPEQILSNIKKMNSMVACELVQQAAYADHIFPDSVNSIHLLTMWDEEAGEPFIVAAFHRFGRHASAPGDEYSQGGLVAHINIETGMLGTARWSPPNKVNIVNTATTHPDTGAQIEGIQITDWTGITTKLLEIARSVPYAPHIGWDVVKTDDCVKILTGNNIPCITALQMNDPLLSNPRAKHFYHSHGIH
jgi:hypothetical protein